MANPVCEFHPLCVFQIGSLKDMYLFELPGGPLEEMPEITKLLLKEENVC